MNETSGLVSGIAEDSRTDRRLMAGLAALVAAEVAFILWIPTFVTVDAATHVGSAALIRDVLTGAGGLHLTYVQPATFPAPNLLPELALGTSMLILDPGTAEKLLQVAYVVALPLALLYAVRGVDSRRDWIALLALPMTFTFAFAYGFYDFSFGVVVFLIAAGHAWRHRLEPRWRDGATLGLCGLLLYLTHIVAFAELVVFLMVIVGWRLLMVGRADGVSVAGRAARSAVPLLVGMAPSIGLAGVFFAGTGTDIPAHFHPFLLQAAGVLSLSLGLATFSPWELVISTVLALTLLLACIGAVRVRRSWKPAESDALLAFAVLAGLLALVAPSDVSSGGSFIPERLTLFPVFGLALWLASARLPAWVGHLASAAWIAVAIAFFAVRLPTYLDFSGVEQDYMSVAACMADGATMIQVNLARYPSGSLARTDPFTEETGRIAALTHGHDLGNFEGSFPFSLFRNRTDNDPFRYLLTTADGFESVPPGVDLQAYATRPGGEVDYVIVFGTSEATASTLASTAWSTLSAQLAGDYQLVARSSGGLATVYERTGSPVAAAGAALRAATSAPACHPDP